MTVPNDFTSIRIIEAEKTNIGMALFNILIHFEYYGSKVFIKSKKVKHFELPVQLDGTQIDFCIHDMTTAEVKI